MNTHPRRYTFRDLTPSGEAWLAAIVIAALHLALSLPGMMVGALNDDGVYTVLGKAIAEGRGYHSLHLAGSPVQEKYPPGFPVILSALWRMAGSVEGVQRLVALLHPAVTGATAGFLWWLGRARMEAPRAMLALFVLTPLVLDASIQYFTIPLSEPWFMLGSAAALVLWEKARAAEDRHRMGLLVVTGIVVAATILTRSQAIVLVPAVLVGLASRRFSAVERIAAIAAMVAPLAAWHLYHRTIVARGPQSGLPDEVDYATWFGSGSGAARLLSESVSVNLDAYTGQLGPYLTHAAIPGRVVTGLILVAMLAASIQVIRRHVVLGISAACALALVLVWPFAQDRLLLSVLPFTGLALAASLGAVAPRLSIRESRGIAALSVIVIGLVLARQATIRSESVSAFSSGGSPGFFSPGHVLLTNSRFIAQISDWLRMNTKQSDRVMIDNLSGVYLYTGRVTAPANPSESRFGASAFAQPGRYLASRILRDSLNHVIVAVPGAGIVGDLNAVRERCPGVLAWGGVNPGDPQWILDVTRDEHCLGVLAGPERSARNRQAGNLSGNLARSSSNLGSRRSGSNPGHASR